MSGVEDLSGLVVTINELATTTAADGSYSFDGVPIGYQVVSALAPSSVEEFASVGVTVVEGQDNIARDLQLTPLGDIEGRVIVADAPDSGGASVSVRGPGPEPITTGTDATGYYRLRRVPAGIREVTATYPGRFSVIPSVPVRVTYQGLVRANDIRLEPVGGAGVVSGRVTIEGESSNAGVVVSLIGPRSYGDDAGAPETRRTTGDDGAFVFEGLTTGVYDVLATADSTLEGRIVRTDIYVVGGTVALGAISFTPVGRLAGSVALAGGGDPKNTVVFLAGGGRATAVDAHGNWSFDGAPAGTCTVRASHAGYVTAEVADIKVVRGQTASVPAVTLAASPPGTDALAEVRGRAVRVGGTDSAGMKVTFGSREALTDASGAFAITGLTAGAFPLEIHDGNYLERFSSVLALPGTPGFLLDAEGHMETLTGIEIFPAQRVVSGYASLRALMPDGAIIYQQNALMLHPVTGAEVRLAAGLYAGGSTAYPALQVSASKQRAVVLDNTNSLFSAASDGTTTLIEGPIAPRFRLSQDGARVAYRLPDGTRRVATIGEAPKTIGPPCLDALSAPPDLSRDGRLAIFPNCAATGATVVDVVTDARFDLALPFCPGSAVFAADGGWAYYLSQCSPTSAVVAVDLVAKTASALPQAANTCTTGGVSRGLAFTPNGEFLVYVASGGALIARNRTTGATITLANSAQPCSIRVTDTHVAYSATLGASDLFVAPLAGGAPVNLGEALSVELSPDTHTLAYTTAAGEVLTATSSGGDVVSRLADMRGATVSFSPDSQHLVARSVMSRLAAVNLSSGATRTIVTLPIDVSVQANQVAVSRRSTTNSFQNGLYRAELP